ncbi:hypothetical protein WR25_00490 [Diploscapter pachys]|uniref:Uncharacterized protein n=1 Tax=Diploscapter pachys TaxID=2018661 RepID=A0A2A2M5K8_9BILA|nr:hypothetical protein WR25_00490 [Diploscapter pachys]
MHSGPGHRAVAGIPGRALADRYPRRRAAGMLRVRAEPDPGAISPATHRAAAAGMVAGIASVHRVADILCPARAAQGVAALPILTAITGQPAPSERAWMVQANNSPWIRSSNAWIASSLNCGESMASRSSLSSSTNGNR